MADDSFLGGLLGAPDNTTVDPNTGMTAAQRQQSIYGTFGNLGALLMAAGQKQMPSERAKYLAQIGNIPGQLNQQLTDAQKLYMQKQQFQGQQALQKQQLEQNALKLKQQTALSDYLKQPEITTALDNLSPEMKVIARGFISSGDISGVAGLIEKTKPQIVNGMIVNQQQGFTLDPTSGMKYDIKTGNVIQPEGASTTAEPVDLTKHGLPSDIRVNDFFHTLPEAYRQKLANVYTGQDTLSGAARGNGPAMERMKMDVVRAFPDYRPAESQAMADVYKSISNHKTGNLGAYADSVGTMAEHYNTLADASEGLKNAPLVKWNAVKNKFESETGDPAQAKFAASSNIYLSELAKVLKGGGVPTNADKEHVAETFNKNMSNGQLRVGLQTMNDLAQARIDAVDSGTERTFGSFYNPDKHSVVTPFAKKQMEKAKANEWLYPKEGGQAASGGKLAGASGGFFGPSAAAIADLQANPHLADEFDAKYKRKGLAASILSPVGSGISSAAPRQQNLDYYTLGSD